MNPNLLKVIAIIIIVFLLIEPVYLISIRKINTYRKPNNKRNWLFLVFGLIELVAVIILSIVFQNVVKGILNIPWIGNLISKKLSETSAMLDFVVFTITAIILNFLILQVYIIFKAFFAKKINKVEQKTVEQTTEEFKEKKKKKKRRLIFKFIHRKEEINTDENGNEYVEDEFGDLIEKEKKNSGIKDFIAGLFFEAPDYIHVKPWVFKCTKILQVFIYFLEAIYFIIFLLLTIILFYPLPDELLNFLIDVLGINKWFIYPFASIIIFQEICNIFATTLSKSKNIIENFEEEVDIEKLDPNLSELQLVIKKRFDEDHHLRYYPPIVGDEIPSYKCTNVAFEPALNFISEYMKIESGHIVQSYLECLDAMYNDNNVYFCASFYSEFGEYLVAYTYTRLLAGERVIFIIPDSQERQLYKKYIRRRLNKLTKSQEEYTWRVYTSDERLDQADVLIASPEEFKNDNIVINYPVFFEEVCNAIFIKSDQIVMSDSYLCPIMAMRLQRATNDRIKFLFLTDSIYRGFAAGSLPKFFCLDKVLSFSGARENEKVFYNLWNSESSNNRIYNKFGQKLTSPEAILAEMALAYNVDGVRIITDAQIEHGDRETLTKHKVEINNFYKEIPDTNFLIYTDTRCNLSASVYLCARFRGKKHSIIHILSKPYLLREFFMSKMTYEDFIKRSSFIQPRVTEHVNNQKLSLLKIFCDATDDNGLVIEEFIKRMRNVIALSISRQDKPLCKKCEKIIKEKQVLEKTVSILNVKELTEYLIAGLCDDENTTIENSYSKKAKDYFIIVESSRSDGFNVIKTKTIFFKHTKEVFDRLLNNSKRVALILNDEEIGTLNTYPARVDSEYLIGQNITYNNVEYEIEQISSDKKSIFLKRENVTFKNILDTIFLRRYNIKLSDKIGLSGVLYFTNSNLKRLIVTKHRMEKGSYGETYGFYNLMSDSQTLDFVNGVLGNPLLDTPVVRNLEGEVALEVTLEARIECNDEMRLLLSAIFNEFIKTLFPDAYRCIAICPILEKPFEYDDKHIPEEYEDFVKKLYPYLKNLNNKLVEEDKFRCRFIFINDCNEDLGVLDWFYDRLGHLMQELLINVYSYLAWLRLRLDQKHYIYFGGTELPKSFDLEGACELLNGLNLLLSDSGIEDIETASEEKEDVVERCSFCHNIVESGRFTIFNNTRFICAECFEVANSQEILDKLYEETMEYLKKTYPKEVFNILTAKLKGQYFLEKGQELSEYYYKLDLINKIVCVEEDIPVNNAKISLLRATISLWQSDNELLNSYINGQLYYEEIQFLNSIGKENSAKWVYENVSQQIRMIIDQIIEFIKLNQTDENKEMLTSFDFLRKKSQEILDEEMKDETDEEEDDDEIITDEVGLFNHLKTKRFWKQYLHFIFDPESDDDLIDTESKEEDNQTDDTTENETEDNQTDDTTENETEDNQTDDTTENETEDNQTDDTTENETEDDQIDDTTENETEDDQIDDETTGESPKANSYLEYLKGIKINAPSPEDELVNSEEDEEMSTEENIEDQTEDITTEEPIEEDPLDNEFLSEDERRRLMREKIKKEREEKRKKQIEEREEKRRKAKLEREERRRKRNEERKRRKDDLVEDEQTEDEIVEDQTEEIIEETEVKKDKKKKPNVEKKPKSYGERMVPYEEEEDKNPKIKLYNLIARAAYDYSTAEIPLNGVSQQEAFRIFGLVCADYPELFWLYNCRASSISMTLIYRCLTPDNKVDKKQIERKIKELRKAASPFIRGITKRTDPYQAVLTVYRRLILTLDYDMVGYNNEGQGKGNFNNLYTDDNLRSLYSALVTHKVVCAGYAVAFQYLMNLIGISCAYVVSELVDNAGHAFNIVRIKKKYYYIDPTWGDWSTNLKKTDTDDLVLYNYCCVPYREFIMVDPGTQHNHIPNKQYYPNMKQFENTEYEYHRYHNAYFSRMDEMQIVDAIINYLKEYDPKDCGRFTISLRVTKNDPGLIDVIYNAVWQYESFNRIVNEVKKKLKGNKLEKKLIYLTEKRTLWKMDITGTIVIACDKINKK